MERQALPDEHYAGAGPGRSQSSIPSLSLSSSLSSVGSDFSAVINAWEAEHDAQDASVAAAPTANRLVGTSGAASCSRPHVHPAPTSIPSTVLSRPFGGSPQSSAGGSGADNHDGIDSSAGPGPSGSQSAGGSGSGSASSIRRHARPFQGSPLSSSLSSTWSPPPAAPASTRTAAAAGPSTASSSTASPSRTFPLSMAQPAQSPAQPQPPQPPQPQPELELEVPQPQPEPPSPQQRPPRRPQTAAAGRVGGGGAARAGSVGTRRPWSAAGAAAASPAAAAPACARRSTSAVGSRPAGSLASGVVVASNGGQGDGGGGSGSGSGVGRTGAVQRRRAAFIAGSVSGSQWKTGGTSLPPRDILLPRLPGPTLALIVPLLPPAIRAALRVTCKALRSLVDCHTLSLTLRPDRQAADDLKRKHTKVYSLFPMLQHATVVLAGAGSGPEGPSAAGASSTSASTQTGAAAGAGAGPQGHHTGHVLASTSRRSASTSSASASAASGQGSPRPPLIPLPLSGWLMACGTAACLTSLTLHVADIGLLEDLALGLTHPHVQRLEMFFGRSGNPHATSPPVVQFMAGTFPELRHLRLAWAAGGGGAGGSGGAGGGGVAGGGGGGGGGGGAVIVSTAHGPRRLFLDGRPRLGPVLLATLSDLRHLESLELQGFLIDTDGHGMLVRHWPLLGPRLRRLVLSGLHLLVPAAAPPEEQLGELLGSCCHLQELHADLCLPASAAGTPGAAAAAAAAAAGGPNGPAAAALAFSLMHAARDERAVQPEFLPVSLTRLSLPGVCLTAAEDLVQLSRLRALTSLEVTALGPRAGEHLTALQELRLLDCSWRQVLGMLPWKAPQRQPTGAEAAAAAITAAAAASGVASSSQDAAAAAAGAAVPSCSSVAASGAVAVVAGPGDSGAGPSSEAAELAAAGSGSEHDTGARAASEAEKGACSGNEVCGLLRFLEVVVSERLDDWDAADRALLARVARGLMPLLDADCRLKLKISQDAEPDFWDEYGKPWEPEAVWRHIKTAQSLRRLQAETKAVAERMARGRMLQAARRKEKERPFVDR